MLHHCCMLKNSFSILCVSFLTASPGLSQAKTLMVHAGGDAQERLQEALIVAQPGDVVELGAGKFILTDGLSLDVNMVTVKGQGAKETILDFTDQTSAGEGLLVTSDDVVLREFAVENSKGDGIKSKGADRIVYHKLRVEWTGGPNETNGSYGIYPVESQDVLIDSVIVRGASDAGIYVGQSRNIIVRGSVAYENVAGIEIENSFDADVYDNVATSNAGGILIFDLPNLPQMGGRNVRVFENIVMNNMTANFAPKGNIVASVPTGTGIMVMANRNVQIFDNVIGENGTSNIMIVGYPLKYDDAKYDPIPSDITVWDNQHTRAGWAPDIPGGKDLAAAFGGNMPPIFWSGAGGQQNAPIISDDVIAVSLGLSDPLAAPSTAQPAPLPKSVAAPQALPAVVMPVEMEAVVG
jgi:parallel beta-helix repeat protein